MKSDPFVEAVHDRDGEAIKATLAADVRFFSPVVFKPYEGREVVGLILAEGAMKVFGDDGLITELKVMVRPLSGLNALAAAMGERFEALGLTPPS